MSKHIHFIAIGGSAMHNLAIAMSRAGYQVSGSDDQIFEPSRTRLEKEGILPQEEGWFPEKLKSKPEIILGMHAKADNPELLQAKALGLKINSYPEFLAKCMKDLKRVVIAGSHGKTTITSMLLHVLNAQNIDLAYMVGAQLEGFDCMVKLSSESGWGLIEGDEYLSSPLDLKSKFLWYKPHVAIITGIAWDHYNVFKTESDYIQCFKSFIDTIEHGGTLIYCAADTLVLKVVEECERHDLSFIPYQEPDYSIKDGQFIVESGEGNYPMQVIGKHNMYNLQGALCLARAFGLDENSALKSLQGFSGAAKRLQKLNLAPWDTSYLDFAHAPSKVKATVSGVKESFPDKRVVVVLELHTYSSLNKDFIPHYKDSLNPADEVYIYYDPKAMEIKRMPPLEAEWVSHAFNHPKAEILHKKEEITEVIFSSQRNNDVLLLLSSGNFGGVLKQHGILS